MNTKLKCLLLDDELPGLTYLKMLCEQIPELEIVKTFNNPEKLLAEISNIEFDLCITDKYKEQKRKKRGNFEQAIFKNCSRF